MPSGVSNTTSALSPAASGKSFSSRSSADCDCVSGMRKLSLYLPSSDPARTRIAIAATIQMLMNYQRWRTARLPRCSRKFGTVAPPVGAHADTVPRCFGAPSGTLDAQVERWMRNRGCGPCDHEPVRAEFVDLPGSGRVFRSSRRVHLGDVDATGTVRLEALAPFPQDVATDDADDAQLSEARGVWVLRSSDLEIVATPVYHEAVELATFCSGTGPRWAERRTRIVGDRGALVDAAALWVFIDRITGRPLALDDDFHDRYAASADGRRVRGRLVHDAPPDDVQWRPWPLRTSDFDVLDHVNNARSLEAVEDELVRCFPGRIPVRARIEYRGTLERGDDVALVSTVSPDDDGEVLAVWLVVDGDVRVSATAT